MAANFDTLSSQTRLWTRTWYDSTLPDWFLIRTLTPVNCLATQAFHAFDNGRYWGWEGVDCCPGTCQHVWQYAQSVSRLFPSIERDLRERVDFGLAWRSDGTMGFRAENDRHVAHDGFCGTILRAYREHQMAPDAQFLERVWPRIKTSVEFIMSQDRDADGLLEGEQMNTLDTAWFGPMAWISSLYLVAVSAGAAMADEMGDAAFAGRCRERVEAGRKSLVAKLYNGEYFIHRPPDYTRNNTNIGCHSDQMLGQSMALQVNFRGLFPKPRPARHSITLAVQLHARHRTLPGKVQDDSRRPVVCHARRGRTAGHHLPARRGRQGDGQEFGICLLLQRMLDRLRVSGRRPDALGRHGHRGTGDRSDDPRPLPSCPPQSLQRGRMLRPLRPGNGQSRRLPGRLRLRVSRPEGSPGLRAACAARKLPRPFTAAEGWGTITQKREAQRQHQGIEVRWGKLRLKTLAFEVPEGFRVDRVAVSIAGQAIEGDKVQKGRRVEITLAREVLLGEGQRLEATLTRLI